MANEVPSGKEFAQNPAVREIVAQRKEFGLRKTRMSE
jgi:hypothetical protein